MQYSVVVSTLVFIVLYVVERETEKFRAAVSLAIFGLWIMLATVWFVGSFLDIFALVIRSHCIHTRFYSLKKLTKLEWGTEVSSESIHDSLLRTLMCACNVDSSLCIQRKMKMSSTSKEEKRLRFQTRLEVSVLTVCMIAVLIAVLIQPTSNAIRGVNSRIFMCGRWKLRIFMFTIVAHCRLQHSHVFVLEACGDTDVHEEIHHESPRKVG